MPHQEAGAGLLYPLLCNTQGFFFFLGREGAEGYLNLNYQWTL